MRNEDEMIREALKLDVSASKELNNKILKNVSKKKSNIVVFRAASIAALFLVVLLGTGIIANAATDNGIIRYLRGVIDSRYFVFDNGSDTLVYTVEVDGENVDCIEYTEDDVIFYRPVTEGETEYSLYLKVKGSDGIDHFINLSACVDEGETTKELYYAIRGGFLWQITKFQGPVEKAQIIEALKAAADESDIDAVKNALTDVAYDYENNRRIFCIDWPGWVYNSEKRIIVYEDITDLPAGDCAIIVNNVDKDLTFIYEVHIDENVYYVDMNSGNLYSDEYYQEVTEKNLPIYDLR